MSSAVTVEKWLSSSMVECQMSLHCDNTISETNGTVRNLAFLCVSAWRWVDGKCVYIHEKDFCKRDVFFTSKFGHLYYDMYWKKNRTRVIVSFLKTSEWDFNSSYWWLVISPLLLPWCLLVLLPFHLCLQCWLISSCALSPYFITDIKKHFIFRPTVEWSTIVFLLCTSSCFLSFTPCWLASVSTFLVLFTQTEFLPVYQP